MNAEEILFPPAPYRFATRAARATGDPELLRFVENGTKTKHEGRLRAMPAAFGERVDDIRALASDIKRHTLDHLDHYLDQFIDAARASGAQVHFAATSEQAVEITLAIARARECRSCVKSKSMVTEEVRLVPALDAIGCRTIETDLGEYILQLDRDAPSHIVAPMIHKNRASVARAFERELGAEYTEDVERLTGIARAELRAAFAGADLGISGGNFLVADTGSVVICTNEGNGRLSTSVPRVHVALVGIEKLVPTRDHLSVLLKVLARSSTAQPLTCYTHVMTGPRRADELDGPDEMHIVLVDHGRSGALGDATREMLSCIRCGACLNSCPVYRKIGGHSYGSVYSGPIGAILTPTLRGLEHYPDLAQASSLCGACTDACPVQIDIPGQLLRLRAEAVESGATEPAESAVMRAWAASLKRPWTYRAGAWFQRRGLRLLARLGGTLERGDAFAARGWLRKAPWPLSGWTDARDLPTPPARGFRDWWNEREVTPGRRALGSGGSEAGDAVTARDDATGGGGATAGDGVRTGDGSTAGGGATASDGTEAGGSVPSDGTEAGGSVPSDDTEAGGSVPSDDTEAGGGVASDGGSARGAEATLVDQRSTGGDTTNPDSVRKDGAATSPGMPSRHEPEPSPDRDASAAAPDAHSAGPFGGSSRAGFLARVRAGLGDRAGRAPGPAPTLDESLVRLVRDGEDLLARFAEGARAVGMHVHLETRASAVDRVRALLVEPAAGDSSQAEDPSRAAGSSRAGESGSVGDSTGVGDPHVDSEAAAERAPLRILDGSGALGRELGVRSALADAHWLDEDAGKEAAFGSDVGLSDVRLALAETGTLVCTSGPGRSRTPSLVPPRHVALLRASDIVPDMLDSWRRTAAAEPSAYPSSHVLITGPSKTADIEGILITGVHGPERVDIVVLTDA